MKSFLQPAGVVFWIMFVNVALSRAGVVEVEPGGSTVAGKTIGDWTADWWRWDASITGPDHPLLDTTGVDAKRNQAGPVFFVAGTPGGPAVTRAFNIPTNKYVLVPLINWIVFNGADPGFASTAAEAKLLADNTIDPAKLVATIDGVPVPNLASHREASSANFTISPATGNPFYPAATFTDANADGYWLMLAPLPAGSHTFEFGGTSLDYPTQAFTVSSFTVAVTDHVTAVPLPPAVWPGLGTLGAIAFAGWRAARRRKADCGA